MNNNWYNERIVQLKIQDLEHEIDQHRLLREAGLADEDRLARLGRKVYGGMLAVAQWLKNRSVHVPTSFRRVHKKTI